MAYFGLYATLTATVFGIGLPVYWTVKVRRRPVAELGVTRRWLGLSLGLQLVFTAFQLVGTLANVQLPPLAELVPLVSLALAIGLFEAI